MKSKLKSRCPIWVATLTMIATMAIGLQPWSFSSGTACTCDAKASVDTNESDATCCGNSAEQALQQSCSLTKKAGRCACEPEAADCECGGCGCSEANDSKSSMPAIPTNETTELVSLNLICAAPFVGFPRESDNKRAGCQKAVVEHAALTSQQTCILLSRFTC